MEPIAISPDTPHVDTHLSRVFLRERDVLKIKRAVNLGFVDFTTEAAREAACRAEVALNARLAPDVYLGVERVAVDGTVEWAVHMRRLPDECRADELLGRGALTGEDIDRVASRIAEFHATAACDDRAARFGAPEAIAANVEENFAQTRASIARYAPAEADEILAWQRAFLRDHDALFRKRIEGGRVRDGHGDLRLEHVYLDDARAPIIIDCIEFADRFRFADVCADIAFLSMDLAAHRRVDLAERLLARYARDANDFDLYALVDFYESYRAFVRAKVASMLAMRDDVPADVRARAEGDARRHYLVALAADRRSLLAPAVVAVGGVIASGKSTIAARLSDAMSAAVVDADRTRKAMLGKRAQDPVHEAAWRGAYDPAFTERVYDEIFRRAGVVLASGRPVILDASFRAPHLRARARALAERHGVPFRFVECRADADVCRARLVKRAREVGVSDGRLAIFDAFRAEWQSADELPPDERVVVDTTAPLDACLSSIRDRIDSWPAGLVG